VWSNVGPAPAPDEIEVTVMGPGYGEAIAVHFGKGEWLLCDSCGEPGDITSQAASLKYLRALHIPVEHAVKRVVVSHWDDDHVRGIGEIIEACPSAEVCFALTLTKREFTQFVEQMGVGASATDGAGVSNFRHVLKLLHDRKQKILRAAPGRVLFKDPVVKSWSPSDEDDLKFLEYLAQRGPQDKQTKRKAVPGAPNLTSVVVSIDWKEASVLLGADMLFDGDDRHGWGAVVAEANSQGFVKGGLVKIPHHGSDTGHDSRMWSDLLEDRPISVIAPFGRGVLAKRPPKSSDIRRIIGLSSMTFLTAKHVDGKLARKDPAVKRSLREGSIRLTAKNPALGVVRFRRAPGGPWRHERFGAAIRVK